MQKIKKILPTLLLLLVFLAGLCVLLYPTVSNWWNVRVQSHVVSTYDKTLESLSREDTNAMRQAAMDYNSRLAAVGSGAALSNPDVVDGYEETLNVTGSGIMGYITIEKIDVKLPIYHGTSASVLNVGAGHLEGSSLPVGSAGTHSVISAHRGLPSARMFTDLDRMTVGDCFVLHVLGEELTYEIDQIVTVLPTEIEELYIHENADYCTLMTCTPYGINTHRLLLRGKRIYPQSEAIEAEVINQDSVEETKEQPEWLVWGKYLLGAVILVLLVSEILVRVLRVVKKH